MLRVIASAVLFAFVLTAALSSASLRVVALECDPDTGEGCSFRKVDKGHKKKVDDGAKKKSHKLPLLRKSKRKSHTPPPPRP
jgi:hypothetical protein